MEGFSPATSAALKKLRQSVMGGKNVETFEMKSKF